MAAGGRDCDSHRRYLLRAALYSRYPRSAGGHRIFGGAAGLCSSEFSAQIEGAAVPAGCLFSLLHFSRPGDFSTRVAADARRVGKSASVRYSA